MPSLKVHCAMSMKRTGQSFRDLHEWIDSPSKEMGYNHRVKRHAYNLDDEKYIKAQYPDPEMAQKAVVEWLFHIALDNISTSFKMSKRMYGNDAPNSFKFGMTDSNFIFLHTSKESNIESQFNREERDEEDKDDEDLTKLIFGVIGDIKKAKDVTRDFARKFFS